MHDKLPSLFFSLLPQTLILISFSHPALSVSSNDDHDRPLLLPSYHLQHHQCYLGSVPLSPPCSKLNAHSVGFTCSAMRKNSRWAHASSYSGSGSTSDQISIRSKRPEGETVLADEEELMAGFVDLRRSVLENTKRWSSFFQFSV